MKKIGQVSALEISRVNQILSRQRLHNIFPYIYDYTYGQLV